MSSIIPKEVLSYLNNLKDDEVVVKHSRIVLCDDDNEKYTVVSKYVTFPPFIDNSDPDRMRIIFNEGIIFKKCFTDHDFLSRNYCFVIEENINSNGDGTYFYDENCNIVPSKDENSNNEKIYLALILQPYSEDIAVGFEFYRKSDVSNIINLEKNEKGKYYIPEPGSYTKPVK